MVHFTLDPLEIFVTKHPQVHKEYSWVRACECSPTKYNNNSCKQVKLLWQFNDKFCDNIAVVVVLFWQSIENFWLNWKLKRLTLVSATVCQQYTSHSSAGMKTAIRDLELNIKYIEDGLNRNPDVSTGPLQQKEEWSWAQSCVRRLKELLSDLVSFSLKRWMPQALLPSTLRYR